MAHFYHCVHCKTNGCKAWLAVKYIGPDDPVSSTNLSLPGSLLVACTACKETHIYRVQDIQPCKLADPPSPDFIDMF
jgi:hypothetical protein